MQNYSGNRLWRKFGSPIELEFSPVRSILPSKRCPNLSGWVAVVLLLVVGVYYGQTPQPTGMLHGYVFDSVTATKMLATVTLLNSDRVPIRQMNTVQGEFQFRDVPPGYYILHAEWFGYIPWEYGQVGFDSPPVEIAMGPGSDLELSVALMRGSTIRGQLADSQSLPINNANVQLLVLRYDFQGRRYLTSSPRIPAARTNGGTFEFLLVPPGDYYIRALLPNTSIRSYFPGTPDVDGAAEVHVPRLPTNLQGMDFFFRTASQLKVTGRFAFPDSTPQSGRNPEIYLIPRGLSIAKLVDPPMPLVDFDAAHETFELHNVVSGDYDLFVRSPSLAGMSGLSARVPVIVRDEDVVDLVAELVPEVDVQIEFQLDTAAQLSEQRSSQTKSILFPEEWRPSIDSLRVPAGLYRLGVVPTDGLFIARAWLGQQNALGSVFEVGPKTSERLVIELSGEGAKFEGVVRDVNQRSVPLATVVLIPPLEFRLDISANKSVVADSSGHFLVQGIRPGVYTAFAFSAIEPNAWLNEEFMSPYRALGRSLNFNRGGLLQQDIRLTTITR